MLWSPRAECRLNCETDADLFLHVNNETYHLTNTKVKDDEEPTTSQSSAAQHSECGKITNPTWLCRPDSRVASWFSNGAPNWHLA